MAIGKIHVEMEAKCRCGDLAWDNTFVPYGGLAGVVVGGADRPSGEPQFTVGSLGAKALGKFELLTGTPGECKGPHCLGFSEIRGGIELGCCEAEKPALEGDWLGGQFGPIDRWTFARCTAASTHGASVEDDLRSYAGDLGLPDRILLAGEVGHLREMVAEFRVPGFEQGQQFVTDAIARECQVTIRGVFAPGLASCAEEGFDFGAGGTQDGAEDATFGRLDDGMNAG